MLKYAKSYIEDLLFHTEPLKAVHTLCSIWAARPDISEDREFFGLSEPEFRVHCCLHYLGEVSNGGHYQFFLNPFGRHAGAVARALASLQFRRAAHIFSRACSLFPSSDIPHDDAARQVLVQQLSESAIQRWTALDRELYAIDRDYWPRLLDYLREHESQNTSTGTRLTRRYRRTLLCTHREPRRKEQSRRSRPHRGGAGAGALAAGARPAIRHGVSLTARRRSRHCSLLLWLREHRFRHRRGATSIGWGHGYSFGLLVARWRRPSLRRIRLRSRRASSRPRSLVDGRPGYPPHSFPSPVSLRLSKSAEATIPLRLLESPHDDGVLFITSRASISMNENTQSVTSRHGSPNDGSQPSTLHPQLAAARPMRA